MTANSPQDVYAAEQSSAYRKGFVLGLTLAESILLLTFVVLLLLVVGFVRRDAVNAEQRKRVDELSRQNAEWQGLRQELGDMQAAELAQVLADVKQLREVAAAAGVEWDDDFMELVKTIAASGKSADVATLRKELTELRDAQKRALSKMAGAADAKALIQKQGSELDMQRGQILDLTRRLGGVLPSCWTTQEGKAEFVLDVVLDSRGIRLRDRTPATRISDRREIVGDWMLPATRVFSPSEFSNLTRPLFDFGRRSDPECRFYVSVFDGTGADEKERYKALLQTVEGHFYKLQSRDAPPF